MNGCAESKTIGFRLYCGIIVLAPTAMDRFVGETLIDLCVDGDGHYPVLTVLIGADSEQCAIDLLRQRTSLEFPPEQIVCIHIRDISSELTEACEGGWLGDNFGRGAVRVPPVYLCIDLAEATLERAIKYVQELFTDPDESDEL